MIYYMDNVNTKSKQRVEKKEYMKLHNDVKYKEWLTVRLRSGFIDLVFFFFFFFFMKEFNPQ